MSDSKHPGKEPPGEDLELDAVLASVVFAVDDELEHEMAAPDLAAVLEMAAEIDPEAVADGWSAEAALLAPIVTLEEGRRFRDSRNDAQMQAIVASVRAATDHDVAVALAAKAAPSPDPVRTLPVRNRQARSTWYAVAAVAALLLIVTGTAAFTAKLVGREPAQRGPEAIFSERVSPQEGRAQLRKTSPAPRPSPRPNKAVAPQPPAVPEIETQAVEPEPDAQPEARPKRHRRPAPRARPSLEDRLRQLDQQAHQAWKANQLGVANAKFKKIVGIGGKHRLADLAYGDLFTLARRANDTKAERRLWKSYLLRFPRGRFFDDARGGLCREASTQARDTCWQKYLTDVPKGAYRAQAARELDEATP